jgi:hypothetical protein
MNFFAQAMMHMLYGAQCFWSSCLTYIISSYMRHRSWDVPKHHRKSCLQ